MARISVWTVLLLGLIPLLSGRIGEFRGITRLVKHIFERKIAIIFLSINLNMGFGRDSGRVTCCLAYSQ